MTQKIRYWISTEGKDRICIETDEPGVTPSNTITLMYGMKECNAFVYHLFRKTRINLLAKDKLAWL